MRFDSMPWTLAEYFTSPNVTWITSPICHRLPRPDLNGPGCGQLQVFPDARP
jgi:hypothetical protein